MDIKDGEFVLLCGATGSGKTTMLRNLYKDGMGFVMQNPDTQIVTDKVWHELAFGLENLGYDSDSIRRQVAETAAFFGIESWFRKDVSKLSGGQRQILCLASIMVMQPSMLLLDEPTSSLDPIAARDFLEMVARINRDLGVTVVIAEQRLQEVVPLATRVTVIEAGEIICDGEPREVARKLYDIKNSMFCAMPTAARVFQGAALTVNEGRELLGKCAIHDIQHAATEQGESVLELKNVWFKYEKDGADVLRGVSFSANKGETLAIFGGNGAGKTTAIMAAAGYYKPQRGKVKRNGLRIGYLPQEVQMLFDKMRVCDEIEEPELWGLAAERHPYDLSIGEQQKLALAKILEGKPQVLILDEPTKGLDAAFKEELGEILAKIKSEGAAVVIVSHDMEFCAKYADRCALMFDGEIVCAEDTRSFFAGNSFYTTEANRVARGIIENAITAEDIIEAIGGKTPKFERKKQVREFAEKAEAEKKNLKGLILSVLIFAILAPITIYFGMTRFNDRKYYFVSLMLILEAIVPFAVLWRPKTREVVLITTLCGIAVMGRGAFFMLPQIKPILALVVIFAAALGGEMGFIIGVVSAFVSNMMFAQGPWTPWQMFALGIIGMIAGLVFSRRKNLAAICVYGGVAAFFVYGAIMNLSSALMGGQSIVAAFLQGAAFDLVHGVSTVVFLVIFGRYFLDRLGRIRRKYRIGV